MSTGGRGRRRESSDDRGRRLAEEWARNRATVAELCRLDQPSPAWNIRRVAGRNPTGLRTVVRQIAPGLGVDEEAVLARWREILGGSYPDEENGELIQGFVSWTRTADFTAIVRERGSRVGETWARERASSDELGRLSRFGEFLRDMDPEEWAYRLGLLLEPDFFELAAGVTAVRLINPAHGTDEETATAYWRQIAGESLSQQITPNLVVGFLHGAVTAAWAMKQTDDPAFTGRRRRKVETERNARRANSDATDDE